MTNTHPRASLPSSGSLLVGRLDLEAARLKGSARRARHAGPGGLTFLRPRARSNLRPLDAMYGLPPLRGPPKCLTASRTLRLPRRRTTLEPVGARRASWSKVRHSPPAAVMRSRAAVEKRRAATLSLGTSGRRSSSRTAPTTATTFELSGLEPRVSLTMRETEIGGRLICARASASRVSRQSPAVGRDETKDPPWT